jgi:hypothetical protein
VGEDAAQRGLRCLHVVEVVEAGDPEGLRHQDPPPHAGEKRPDRQHICIAENRIEVREAVEEPIGEIASHPRVREFVVHHRPRLWRLRQRPQDADQPRIEHPRRFEGGLIAR